MEYIQLVLNLFLLICSLFVVFTYNPIHSVLFLVLAFCSAASLIILFQTDFLAFVFVIIYVGAIAILFLFVVMMLSLKHYLFQASSFYSVLSIIFWFFFSQLVIFVLGIFHNDLFFSIYLYPLLYKKHK
jgi:NADH:ubiquinone oxidoreductase subunit 6 (subunit J)